MDFLDPEKRFRHKVILLTGYVLIAVAIVIATIILLYQAYGFGFGKNGTVIQNGLLFFSSQPRPAQIYLNNSLAKTQTNTRLVLPAGIYNVKLVRSGYRPWQRTIELNGGTVEHFDYPLLFPTKLVTTKLQSYNSNPGLATQSPDQRWLLIEQPGSITNFDLFDLKNPTKSPTTITLPATLVSQATAAEGWQISEWADDNQHVLLKHLFDGKMEYVLVDRSNPTQSVNLSQVLAADSFTELTLYNKKYDRYYLYNGADDSLKTAALKDPTTTSVLNNVLAYKTYGDNTVLYATNSGAPAGKVLIKEQVNNSQQYTLRTFVSGTTYLLDLTTYSGRPYVAMGAASENKVYIYQDPINQLQALPKHAPVPTQVLQVNSPNYLSFSPNAQFIVAEHGQQFGVYDIENDHGYNYTSRTSLDSPQVHASWMDGNRLTYASSGKLVVFDYDDANQQTLMAANPTFLPFFAPDYSYVYSLAPSSAPSGASTILTRTSLYIPADQP